MSAREREGRELLAHLHDFLERDRRPPAFSGQLAIGVSSERGVDWWQVTCDRVANAAFVDEPDPACDAVLLMGEREAVSILETGRVPANPALLKARGNRALLSRFVDRYVVHRSAIDARAR
jgi:hypothetical protein